LEHIETRKHNWMQSIEGSWTLRGPGCISQLVQLSAVGKKGVNTKRQAQPTDGEENICKTGGKGAIKNKNTNAKKLPTGKSGPMHLPDPER